MSTAQPPLPLLPESAVAVGPAAGLCEGAEGGVVFVLGQASFCWEAGDDAARRLAAVQLVETKLARQVEVAAAFGTDAATLWRWQRAYQVSGLAGLLPAKRGPKGPRKLDAATVAGIQAASAQGATLAAIAAEHGVSTASVRRALGRVPATRDAENSGAENSGAENGGADGSGAESSEAESVASASGGGEPALARRALPVLPAPAARTGDRELARTGLLECAAPVFTEGAHLPLAGLLLVLPALASTGLLEAARGVYAKLRGGFYGLSATLLTLVFLALLREPRAEGATRIRPADLGRVLGLDRAPEVKTIRRKLAELAGRRRGAALQAALARAHAAARPAALGFLSVDGHVRVYSGTRRLPKAHVARMRIAAPAMLETWVADADGEPVFVVTAPPSAQLVSELRRLLPELRALVGADRRVTLVFDRGGYSPELFAEIVKAGFDLITYRKGKCRREPNKAFTAHTFTDPDGLTHDYVLAERGVRLALPKKAHKSLGKTVGLRQVTRRTENGHQTPILSSRSDLAAGELAYRASNRWREENFFKYGRAHFGLDALDSYAAVSDDLGRSVPNPAKNTARKNVSKARSALARAEATLAAAVTGDGSPRASNIDVTTQTTAVQAARTALTDAQAAARAIPVRVPLAQVHPEAMLLDEERKLVTHAIRMAAYNAESALARLLRPHYARAEDEVRALLREAFTLSGDIEVIGTELHVRLDAASAPRRSRALAGLCAELTATETVYPDTELRLVYSVKGYPSRA
ncbi:MAG: putative transposase [Mycobacteriales bacterium]